MEDNLNIFSGIQFYKVERQRSTGVTKSRAQVHLDSLIKQIALERVQEIKADYDSGDYGLGDYFTSLMLNDPVARMKLEAVQAKADDGHSQRSYLEITQLGNPRPRL